MNMQRRARRSPNWQRTTRLTLEDLGVLVPVRPRRTTLRRGRSGEEVRVFAEISRSPAGSCGSVPEEAVPLVCEGVAAFGRV